MAVFIADRLLAHALAVAVDVQHHEAASGKFFGDPSQCASVCASAMCKQNAGQLVRVRDPGRNILIDTNLCAAGIDRQRGHFDLSSVGGNNRAEKAEDEDQHQTQTEYPFAAFGSF